MQNGNVPMQNTPKHIAPPKVGYDYYYLGDQLIEEAPIYADGTVAFEHSTHWLYAPNQWTPTARYQQGELNYVITDQIGTPTELLAEDGTCRWRVKHNLWGSILKQYSANDDDFCNLRFPGQYADSESGLHYNRYRYYDQNTAQYLTPDPIGLVGGFNPYGYVHNPTGWIDPLGLACCQFASRNAAFRAAKRDAGIPMSQQPDKIYNPKTGFYGDHRNVRMTDSNNNTILDRNGNPVWTREYQFTRSDNSKIIIQDHSFGHYYPDGVGNQSSHLNVRPANNTRTGSVPGTQDHYNF